MRSVKIVNLLLISGFLLFVIWACEKSSDNIPTFDSAPTSASLVEEGWQKFREKNFEQAAASFLEANERDALNIGSYVGQGWSYEKIKNLNSAEASFVKAIALGADSDDILGDSYAGMAGVKLAQRNYEEAIANVESAFFYKPDFKLEQDPSINKDDLYLVNAEAYFSLEIFYKSIEFISKISPDYLDSNPNIISKVDTLLPDSTRMSDTDMTGIAWLVTSEDKLVFVSSIENVNISNANISLLDVSNGGKQIEFFSNPIPRKTDQYVVTYYYAEDYGVYIADLTKKLEEVKNELN
jgi:tetratricopeptide (TPR) repeat protein